MNNSARVRGSGTPLGMIRQPAERVLLAVAAVVAALCLPILPWIRVASDTLMGAVKGIGAIDQLPSQYHPLNFLRFVRESKQGILGMWSALLLLMSLAAILLFAMGFVRALKGDQGNGLGRLSLFGRLQAGYLMAGTAAMGTVGLMVFANAHYGVRALTATPFAYLTLLFAIVGYVLSKRLEKTERIIQRTHGFLEEFRRNWVLFLFLVPCFVFLMINNYLPMAGIYFAFTQFNFRDHLFASPYVGLKNFDFLFKAEIGKLTRNTILYNLVFIGLGNVLQIAFAILVRNIRNLRARKISQTMIFMPYFVSYVILRVLVYNLFEYNMGLVNTFLASIGGGRLDFYNTPSYWPWLITLFYLWKNIGYGMVIYLATIMGISDEYYEAARIDGAGIWQQIRFITVPLLKPTFIVLLLYAIGSIMKGQFELFYQLVGNNGALFDVTDIFDTYVYRITTTQPLSMGYGTAAGLFQSLFGFVLVLSANWLIKRKNAEYALF